MPQYIIFILERDARAWPSYGLSRAPEACSLFFQRGFQFRMTVIGEVLGSSVTVFIRNRWPSGETM